MSPVLKAAFWMIGAMISFTSMAVAGRAISGIHDTFEVMLFRSIIGVIIIVSIGIKWKKFPEIKTTQLRVHVWRNIAHFAGQNLWFFAVPLIPLAQLFALEFTSPLWVLLLAPLFLGESLTTKKIAYAALGFVGVWMVAQPNFSHLDIGVLTGGLSAICFAVAAIGTRLLTRTDSVYCILFYLTVTQTLFGLICAGWDGDILLPTATSFPWLVLIGVAGLCAHFCLTTALSLAPASIVMPIDFGRLPLVAIIGVLFYNEPLNGLILLGGAIIFLANYLNVRQTS